MPSGLDKSGTETKQYQVKDEEILPSISGHRLRSLEPVEGSRCSREIRSEIAGETGGARRFMR